MAETSQVNHSEPNITLVGRVAAAPVGMLVKPWRPSLHFTLLIDDLYSGIRGVDGQPTMDWDMSLHPFQHFKLIKSNFYDNTMPGGIVVKIDLKPPNGMSRIEFANKLIITGQNFSSYTLAYSAPKRIGGAVMLDSEYNSSSYIAGLLKSVMGYVPVIDVPGYQTPGWENPIPTSYFKGEALKK